MWPCLRDPWIVGMNNNPLYRHGGQDRSSLTPFPIAPQPSQEVANELVLEAKLLRALDCSGWASSSPSHHTHSDTAPKQAQHTASYSLSYTSGPEVSCYLETDSSVGHRGSQNLSLSGKNHSLS